VLTEKTSKTMRQLMRLVVTRGTGKNADAKGYLVGGKTGTADKPDGGKYTDRALISSFVAAFPVNKPRYVVFALLDEPVGTKRTFNFATGGWVAAPVIKKVISQIAPMLGVAPDLETEMDTPFIPNDKKMAKLAKRKRAQKKISKEKLLLRQASGGPVKQPHKKAVIKREPTPRPSLNTDDFAQSIERALKKQPARFKLIKTQNDRPAQVPKRSTKEQELASR